MAAYAEPVTDLQVRLLGTVPFQETWELQREIHAAVVAGDMPDTLLLLQHHSVYTAGRRTQPEDRPLDGTPVIDVDRGGRITWHGPGQLVGYPIIRLPAGVYVVDYVRRLEEALIRAVQGYGLPASRVMGRSGVWLPADATRPERKLVAIGIRYAHGATLHGFALNVLPNQAAFGRIVPCGIADAGVSSLAEELADPPTVAQAAWDVVPHLDDLLGRFVAFDPD